jgi:hypothetical protein
MVEKNCETKLPEWKIKFRLKGKHTPVPIYFYAAMNYYPELARVKIKIKPKKIAGLMQARPGLLNCFRRGTKRTYKIFINSTADSNSPTVNLFTFNALVGVAGHELAHIAAYTRMRTGQLFRMGLQYKKGKIKQEVEQITDKSTLEHKLGWQLYDFAVQCENLPNTFMAYKENKKTNYLSSIKMLDLMLVMGYR